MLEVDDYGTARKTTVVSYPRQESRHDPEQTALTVVVTESDVIHQDDRVVADDIWHLAVPVRTKVWELTGTPAWTDDSTPATVSAVAKEGREVFQGHGRWLTLRAIARNCAQTIPAPPSHELTLYRNDALPPA